MKKLVCLMLAASGSGLFCSARSHEDRWPVRNESTIRQSVPLSGEDLRLVVDNIDGYVHVTGSSDSQVEVTAHQTVRAETARDAEEAKEVTLNISSKPGTASIRYDAPWRCSPDCAHCRETDRRFYSVSFDIDVRVPRAALLVISTVNSGDVRIEDAAGPFDIHNVNGGIDMKGISGSGDAHTVNGPVSVRFARNPVAACSLKSINGALDAYFPRDLSANLLFKTFNGQIFSDFEVTPAAVPQPQGGREGGKFVYRNHHTGAAFAGSGGAELSFDTLNGDIRLHRAK